MDRTTTLYPSLLLLTVLVAFSHPSTAQTPEDAYSSRPLIAWSQLQTPQPTPQPLPPPEQIPQPEQPRDQQSKSPADPHSQQEPVQLLAGVIFTDGNCFLLHQADGKSYPVDGDADLRPYANQSVKVLATNPLNSPTIHVLKVEAAK